MRIILLPAIVLIGLSLSLFAGGCGSTVENNANVLIKTSRTAYRADDTINIDITSLSGSAIYYICKGQIRLQLMEGETVRKTWEIRELDSCRRKLPIYLGESVSFSILPQEMDSTIADPAFVTGGEYRFQIDLYEDADCTVLLESEADRLSNRITITR